MRSRLRSFLTFLRNPHPIQNLWRFPYPGGEAVVELRQPFVLIAAGFALVWYILAPIPEVAMGLGALGGLILIAYLWARTMAQYVTAGRKLRYSAFQVGDELEEAIYVRNRSALPVLWAEFTDRSNIPGYTISSVRAVDANGELHWRAHTICRQRGVYALGPWDLLVGEPFNIFQVRLCHFERKEIVVYPPLAPLPAFLLPHSSAVGSHRPLRQPLPAETINANTTRPFAPGDPLRRVHWPTTARKLEPYVKVFEPEASSRVWLVPDFDASVQAGAGPDSTVETMVILAASLASQLLRERLSVGLFALTDGPLAVLPQSDRAHLWALLRALAPLQAVANRPFTETISQARSLMTSQDLLIAITPSKDLEWARQLSLSFVRRASGAGSRRAQAILLDAASFLLPESEFIQPSLPATQTGALLAHLASLGVAASIVRRQDIRPVPGAHGALRRWEFKTLGTGRVVVRQAPRAAGQEPG